LNAKLQILFGNWQRIVLEKYINTKIETTANSH